MTYKTHFVYAADERMNQAIQKVDERVAKKELGFIETLFDEALAETAASFEKIRWAKNLVVVGIGGSDLGGRAIQQALESVDAPMRVIFHGDSTDPVQISRLLPKIKLEETVFNIVSKSGQTVEVLSQYLFFKQKYKELGDDWAKHFLFTTDPQNGMLRQEAQRNGILTLALPPAVGGRFSVLTTVGLLPALAMGADISQLRKGAQDFFTNPESKKIAQELAISQFALSQQHFHVVVMMAYSTQLEEFARWFRQLWAETLGKNGTGLLPIQARGPADQHSQEQFYHEGILLQSVLFVGVEKRKEKYSLQEVDIPEAAYLQGKDFQTILHAEQEAATLGLKKLGRPSATLMLSEVTAYTLGEMFALFELAVVYLAEMFGVDAFNQPGVEEGKQMISALLNKPGFEEKQKEIEALRAMQT